MIYLNETTTEYERYLYQSLDSAFPSFSWCGRFTCKKGFLVKRSAPGYSVILYTEEGYGALDLNGERHALTKDTVAILSAGDDYYYTAPEDGWRFRFIHLIGCAVDIQIDEIKRIRSSVFRFCDKEAIFDRIITSAREKMPLYKAYQLTSELLGALRFCREGSDENRAIAHACKYINENLSSDLTVEAVAYEVSLSRPYLTALFSKEIGMPPSEYVVQKRIERATELLYTTDRPISEIASLCGYPDTSSFIRLFKKRKGITPLAFKKQIPL